MDYPFILRTKTTFSKHWNPAHRSGTSPMEGNLIIPSSGGVAAGRGGSIPHPNHASRLQIEVIRLRVMGDECEGGDLWVGHEQFGDVQADAIRVEQVATDFIHC